MLAINLAFAVLVSSALAAPFRRQTLPCFVTGNVALPAEVADGLTALSGVTCGADEVFTGVPDVTSGGISFSSIDFRNSDLSPLGFALQAFATPVDPGLADLNLLQNQLNVYLAVEAGLRSQPGSSVDVALTKSPKFFIQFQIARARTSLGETLGVADTAEHQLGKVLKNAPGASADEINAVNALFAQI